MTKYQKYAEYKDSGVDALGRIPKEWSVMRGKFLFSEINERSENGDETLLSVSEYYGVKPRGENISEGEYLSRAESLEGYKKCYVNDLVMNIMLAWKRGLGISKYNGIVSPAYSVFRFNNKVSPDFMHYLLRTEEYIKYFKTRSTGIIDSRLRLYPDSFGDIFILLPSIDDQIQITNFLDYETTKIDHLIEKQQQLIELLKEKRQAVISHAVTKGLDPNVPMKNSGVEWLGEVPEHWEIPKLLHITTRIGDGLHSTPVYQEGTGYYFINGNNLVDGEIIIGETAKEVPESEFIKHQVTLDKTTVLLSINGTIGKVALYNNEPVILGKSASYMNCCPEVLPSFLVNYLTTSQAKKYYDLEVTGTTIFNLSLNSIRNMKVPLPPIDEQKGIVQFIAEQYSKYETLIQSSAKQNKLLKERRTALISAAVTGKIDVRNWQAPTVGADTELSA